MSFERARRAALQEGAVSPLTQRLLDANDPQHVQTATLIGAQLALGKTLGEVKALVHAGLTGATRLLIAILLALLMVLWRVW